MKGTVWAVAPCPRIGKNIHTATAPAVIVVDFRMAQFSLG
jgi:hypothetical protein